MGINRWTNMGGGATVGAGPEPVSRFYFSRKQPLNTEINEGKMQGPWAAFQLVGGAKWVGWNPTWRLVGADEKATAGTIGPNGYANNKPPSSAVMQRSCTDPLAAQTIAGTFDIIDCVNSARSDPVTVPQKDSDVRVQVYIYVTVGNTTAVRGVLLDYIDTFNIQSGGFGTRTWTRLVAPQPLTPVVCQAGDRVMIERGVRWQSMAKDPVPTYPVTTWNSIASNYWGTLNGWLPRPDAFSGENGFTSQTDYAMWCEFSPGLQMGTKDYPGTTQIRFNSSDPGSFDNPIDMGDLPYETPVGGVDTSISTVPGEWGLTGAATGTFGQKSGNAIYYKFTASQTNYVFFVTRGTLYPCQVGIFYDPAGGPFGPELEGRLDITLGHSRKEPASTAFQSKREFYYYGRAGSSAAAWVEAGQTYYVCFANSPMAGNHSGSPVPSDSDAQRNGQSGGILQFQGYYQDHVPQQDDLYILNGSIDVVRETEGGGVRLVMLADNLVTAFVPTSIEIDYSKKPLYSFGTGSEFEVADGNPFGWLHSGERVTFGDFTGGFNEIIPLETLSWMPNTAEVDFIEFAEDIMTVFGNGGAPSYLHAMRNNPGFFYQGMFGSGFRLVQGQVGGGNPPAIQDSLPEFSQDATTYFRDISMAASQLGNPWQDGDGLGVDAGVSNGPFPELGKTGMNFITIDENKNILYYTSSSFYTGYSNNTDIRCDDPYIYAWDLTANAQIAKLGPFTLFGTPADELLGIPPTPGLRGMKFIPKDSTLLVINSDRVMRINTNGDVLQWYIPVHPDGREGYRDQMTDVVLTADQDFFWAKDGGSSAIYKFNLETGEQTNFWDPMTFQGTTTQMTIYLPGGFIAPPVATPYPIRRLRQAPHLNEELGWIFYDRFQLEMEMGVGLESGQGVDPQIMLQWSDDGGYSWSNEYWESAGAAGQFEGRALWYRLGRARDRIFRVIMSDPVKWALTDAYIRIKSGTS